MAWHQTNGYLNKWLPSPLRHTCIFRPQWVNNTKGNYYYILHGTFHAARWYHFFTFTFRNCFIFMMNIKLFNRFLKSLTPSRSFKISTWQCSSINLLWPGDTYGSINLGKHWLRFNGMLPDARSHYLNQCWLIIKGVLWHSPEKKISWTWSVTCDRGL